MSHLIVVAGTGTDIGKTHVSEALLLAWGARGLRTSGLKPVESGVGGASLTDAARLDAAATFHVKAAGVALPEALSPHLAARRAGVPIDLSALRLAVSRVRHRVDLLLVELAGGLFSPLTATRGNADFAALLRPDTVMLVAPDRLGVLHEILATTRAASLVPLAVDAVVLVAPDRPDASTGTNAGELRPRLPIPVIATVPRGEVPALARGREIGRIVRWLCPRLGDLAPARRRPRPAPPRTRCRASRPGP